MWIKCLSDSITEHWNRHNKKNLLSSARKHFVKSNRILVLKTVLILVIFIKEKYKHVLEYIYIYNFVVKQVYTWVCVGIGELVKNYSRNITWFVVDDIHWKEIIFFKNTHNMSFIWYLITLNDVGFWILKSKMFFNFFARC